MIRIGDFARLGGVSVATLRHWDDVGLLAPDTVDGETGYRYYGVAQLAQLNRIVALKDLGFSLEQVGRVLEGITLEELRGMLTMKAAEVERQVADEQGRLARISARIRQIELEERMPDYDVILKDAPAMLVASRRVTIPTNDQVPTILGAAFDEAYKLVKMEGANDVGPCIALWYQGADVFENEDAEAAVPIDRPIAGTERVKVYELPGGRMASVVHRGDYANFSYAHAALLSWIESNGYRASGPIREVYLQDAHGDMANAVTEIQYPVEKAG
jgi:DNA-binding transcriptional MerR regulator/DNA gyrase inhibitor GyrI